MVRAWCIWCETESTNSQPLLKKKGLVWVHLKCFEEICDITSDMKTIKEFMEGKRPTKQQPNDTIEKYLNRMEDFRIKWNKTQKLIKTLKQRADKK